MEGGEIIQMFNGVHFNYNSSNRGKYVGIHKIIKYSICLLCLLYKCIVLNFLNRNKSATITTIAFFFFFSNMWILFRSSNKHSGENFDVYKNWKFGYCIVIKNEFMRLSLNTSNCVCCFSS